MGIRCESEAVPATVSCSPWGILSIHATVRLIGWEGDKKSKPGDLPRSKLQFKAFG